MSWSTGSALWELVRPEDRAVVMENIRRQMTGKVRSLRYQFAGLKKDGETVYVEAHGSATVWQGYPAVMGTLLDESDRKKLEAQLIQSEKMKAIGTLAGGIAHDFNNILMAIQGYTSLMLHRLDPNHFHYGKLKGIEELVESGSDLTKQLLGFASGGTYEIRAADLNEIVRKTSTMFARTRKEITIQPRYEAEPCVVDVDSGQIEQMLLNLYVNAWQAMPGGGTLFLGDAKRASRRELRPPLFCQAGQLRTNIRDRHGRGHGRGDEKAYLRALLYHEEEVQGNGARSGFRLQYCEGPWRDHQRIQRERPGRDLLHLSASLKEDRGARRAPCLKMCSRGGRPFSWWTTRRPSSP